MKNKTVRTLIALIVTVMTAFSLSACGNATAEKKNDTKVAEETEGKTTVVTEAETEEETAVVTEAETEEETTAVTEAETEEETAVVTEAETEEETTVVTEAETEEAREEFTADAQMLTADEEELIGLLADDTTVITDDTYAELVSEMQYHPEQFTGKVYQLEGIYTANHKGETPYVYRTLINGEEEIFCGLPLVYAEKNIGEGAWVKATGIVNVHEIEGEEAIALEIVAIQSMEEPGEAELEWNGSSHAH